MRRDAALEHPRTDHHVTSADTSTDTAADTPRERIIDVLIVGAGISGIGMAAHLTRECPAKSYAVIERRERLGGTWDLFRYPGVRSDSDMYTLGYEFEPWTDKTSVAPGERIRSYLENVANKYGIADRTRFSTKVLFANWDSSAALWTLTLEADDGTRSQMSGRFLFMGSGYYDYDQPHDAKLPGLSDFAGQVIHPQFWPDDADFSGKRMTVIGSGATAATIVPALAGAGAQVTMLQRTPTYYVTLPSTDRFANFLGRILPAQVAHAIVRFKNNHLQQMFFQRSRRKPDKVRAFLQRQVARQLGERYDETAFSPPYNPWEQRVCMIPDGDMFAAMRSGKAEIVTGTIARIDSSGIALDGGGRIDADVIITATGLKLAVLGNVAISLDGQPVDFARQFYYRSCMFSDIPNFAALFGYLNAGWTLRVDTVCGWLCRLFTQMDAWGVDVAVPHMADRGALDEVSQMWGFSSGYLRRGRHLLARSATAAPWRLGMDYFADRREMRDCPIDDGVLRFSRAPQQQCNDSTGTTAPGPQHRDHSTGTTAPARQHHDGIGAVAINAQLP